jgi:hypothetical protein
LIVADQPTTCVCQKNRRIALTAESRDVSDDGRAACWLLTLGAMVLGYAKTARFYNLKK